MAKHTFETNPDVEKLWKEYDEKSDACFTKMANNAILEHLKKKLKK